MRDGCKGSIKNISKGGECEAEERYVVMGWNSEIWS